MNDLSTTAMQEATARHDFRFYSRKIFSAPNNRYCHEQRINAALLLKEKEPLQGAVADFFYGCWYDIPYDVEDIFIRIQNRLHPQIERAFRNCINKIDYIRHSSEFATRWSVLITPSLNVDTHRLRISSDDAKEIAKNITTELMSARDNEDWSTIEQIEKLEQLRALWIGIPIHVMPWYQSPPHGVDTKADADRVSATFKG